MARFAKARRILICGNTGGDRHGTPASKRLEPAGLVSKINIGANGAKIDDQEQEAPELAIFKKFHGAIAFFKACAISSGDRVILRGCFTPRFPNRTSTSLRSSK